MSSQRNNLAIYDEMASRWWSDDVRWIRTLKNMVPGRLRYFYQHMDWRGKSVLDLGCAGGFMAEALHDSGAVVTGIDPAEQAIHAARAHAGSRDITYDIGIGEALPYGENCFDAVVCVDVLEHVRDPARVVREVARVLNPGGTFFFDTINRNPLASLVVVTIAEYVLRLLPRGTHDPKMFIRPSELKSFLAAAGLAPQRITGFGPRGLNRRGDLVFGRLPFAGIIYMGTAVKTTDSAVLVST